MYHTNLHSLPLVHLRLRFRRLRAEKVVGIEKRPDPIAPDPIAPRRGPPLLDAPRRQGGLGGEGRLLLYLLPARLLPRQVPVVGEEGRKGLEGGGGAEEGVEGRHAAAPPLLVRVTCQPVFVVDVIKTVSCFIF